MRLSGITKRWILNTLLLIIIMLIIFITAFIVIMRSYYYNSVSLKLSSQYSDSVANFFSLYTTGTDLRFEEGAREFARIFTQKDIIEVWVINKKGKVVMSTSGFEITDAHIPEYEQALASKTRQAEYTGRNEFGEKIMAMTFLLPASETENTGAIRYMISLQSVDKQVGIMLVASFLVLVIVITLVTISGVYFTQSIVNPVRKINETAKQIAKGDLNARIESNQYNDEIGELCETINYMASEIGQSDRMRNDFISTVSHEMKTPLTAIKGWGETLLQMGDTDPSLTQKGLDVIIDEAARLTGVVEDLLDLSKIVNGNMSLRKEKIDVLAELDDAVYVFKDRSMREGIDLMYNVPDAPAPMEADGNRIKQVFVNILDNAFKYTEQGGKISIYAEVRTQETMDPDMCELCIYVEDTGRGISPEDLPRIKEKFYKSNISIRGSGIGLAVCDEIMKLHDGTLDIKSQLGQGTLVTLVFPVEKIIFNVETSAPAEERGTENE